MYLNKQADPTTRALGYVAHYRKEDGKIQYLSEHLIGVSFLTGKFASVIGMRLHGELIGLLHDIGKASWESERYIESAIGLIDSDDPDYMKNFKAMKGKIDHATAGAQYLYRNFGNESEAEILTAQILSLAIASHHAGLMDCLSPDGEDSFNNRMKQADEKTRYTECVSNLDDDIKQRLGAILSDDSLIESTKRKLLDLKEGCDKVDTKQFKVGLLTRFLYSCLIDADRLNTGDFVFPEGVKYRNQGIYESWPVLIAKLEIHLKNFKCRNNIDKIRGNISDACLKFASKPKGLYQLSVPTGGGKTLASLRFAINHAQVHNMTRIIYVIPYTSIIDQNAQTLREIFEDKNKDGSYATDIVLEHHSNLTPEEENYKQKLLAENWDAPIVFTTVVQLLEAFFGSGTRSARRMHQLANAVIIFDEIQTLPIRCVHLFNVATRFLTQACGSTIVLCTATQPLLGKVLPLQRALRLTPEQEMMPNIEELFKELKRVEVNNKIKLGGWSDSEIAELTEQELAIIGSVLIVVNTKNSARNLFKKFLNHPKAETYHLSTDMCPAHRMDILTRIKDSLEANRPIICVSTKLIEAGVDVDFGSVIRYLAGLDSIAQAAGRCYRNGNRNGRPGLGRVFIVNPKVESLDKLIDIRKGQECTRRVLDAYDEDEMLFDNDIIGPKALALYYKYYFYSRTEEMNYPLTKESIVGRDDDLFELLSVNGKSLGEYRRKNQNAVPQYYLRQSFKTAGRAFQAIDSISRGVIVPYGQKGQFIIEGLRSVQDLGKQYHLLKEAQRYSVNVSLFMFDKLVDQKIIQEIQEDTGVFYLCDKRHYSHHYGLCESQTD